MVVPKAGLLATDIGSIANSNPLNFINPSDIANIDVIKGCTSAKRSMDQGFSKWCNPHYNQKKVSNL